MKIMISTSDNSSTDEEDSQELQRLKDAAVTLEPSGGDWHASQKILANISAMNEMANNTKAPSSGKSSRPSLRPKQTYSEDSSELKTTPGFRTHVAKKLSDILDKELQFSESSVEKCSEKQKSSKSGIRLLSSSKKFLKIDPKAVPDVKLSKSKPKSHDKPANSTSDKPLSFTNRKRASSNSNKQTDSSSDSSEDELLAEAAVSFEDIKKKDELLSSFAIPRAPILVIRADKADNAELKKERNPETNIEAKTNGDPVKKKKKKKKHKEKKENSLKEGNEE